MLCLYLNNNEDSNLFKGKSLRLGGSKELYEQNGTYFGDLSAILIENLPFWAEFSCTPSNKVSLMSEWESKLKAIIREAKNENVTSIAGVPSWMLVLLNRIFRRDKKRAFIRTVEALRGVFSRRSELYALSGTVQAHYPLWYFPLLRNIQRFRRLLCYTRP